MEFCEKVYTYIPKDSENSVSKIGLILECDSDVANAFLVKFNEECSSIRTIQASQALRFGFEIDINLSLIFREIVGNATLVEVFLVPSGWNKTNPDLSGYMEGGPLTFF